jgi:signal transduction histidine kinase
MKLLKQERALPMTMVGGLTVVLLVLGILQYRWSGQISEAESARMKARLQTAVMGFRRDLLEELEEICRALRSDPEVDGHDVLASYAEAYRTWKQSAARPSLISSVYVGERADEKHFQVFRLDAAKGIFELTPAPDHLGQLAERLAPVVRAPAPRMAPRWGHPPTNNLRPTNLAKGMPPLRSGRFYSGPWSTPWVIAPTIPALVHPIDGGAVGERGQGPRLPGFLILELDRETLRQYVFPALAERYFGGLQGLDYQVAVLGMNGVLVYSSDPNFRRAESGAADAELDLFGFPPGPALPLGRMALLGGDSDPSLRGSRDEFREHGSGSFGVPRLDLIRFLAAEGDWQLVVKHRRGSLDTVAASIRRRNLALSFGVLLVLAATTAIVVVASQRAQRLAQLQMEFVAGVSHELRTPLSVISSAADNIAHGVVSDPGQLTRYGAVIKKHALQLNRMIEHILLFAASRQDRLHYTLQNLPVEEVIDAALASTEELVRSSGVRIDQSIQPGLPPVLGNLAALSHCLQNLITNAIKYGGQDRWLGLRAVEEEQSESGKCIRITVEDHGAGIASWELREIFQPFYRTAEAKAAQIRGTGLGLPLARSIAEAMGGRLSVTSEPGKGSSFSLRLRVAEPEPGNG